MNCCGCPFCILKGTEQIESVLSIEGFIWYNNMNYSVKEKEYDGAEIFICGSSDLTDSIFRSVINEKILHRTSQNKSKC